MPIYVYETVTEHGGGERFEILQSLHEAHLSHHPETGEPVRRVPAAPGIRTRGLKRSARVDKSSAAATPCGCASNVALAVATQASGLPGAGTAVGKSHQHSHQHGHQHGHHHHHGGCNGHHHHHAKPAKPAGDTSS